MAKNKDLILKQYGDGIKEENRHKRSRASSLEFYYTKKHLEPYITKETKFSTRYFTVELDENDEIVSTNMKNIATVSNDDIENIVKSIDGKEGYYKNFKYRVIHKDSNKFIIFLDCNMQLRALKHTTIRSINIIIIGWIIVLIIISLSSKKIFSSLFSSKNS